jgi:hypothetical protein
MRARHDDRLMIEPDEEIQAPSCAIEQGLTVDERPKLLGTGVSDDLHRERA